MEQHKDAVYQHLLRLCHNREDAEDILIEALQKAYESQHELRHPEAFRVWLTQIARRIYWHMQKREALHPLLELDSVSFSLLTASGPTPDDVVLRHELQSLLQESLAGLPLDYRQVYQWHDIEDLPVKQIARKLGLTEANVKSRIHRAREAIRVRLDAKFHPRA